MPRQWNIINAEVKYSNEIQITHEAITKLEADSSEQYIQIKLESEETKNKVASTNAYKLVTR